MVNSNMLKFISQLPLETIRTPHYREAECAAIGSSDFRRTTTYDEQIWERIHYTHTHDHPFVAGSSRIALVCSG